MGLKKTRHDFLAEGKISSNEIFLWYKLANDIWKNVLRSHQAYTGYDVEDTTPGYGRDPITKDICLKAQGVLNDLFKRHLLSTQVEVVASPDGDLEFEWWTSIVGEGFSVGVSSEPWRGRRQAHFLYAGPFQTGQYRGIDSIDEVESNIRKILVEDSAWTMKIARS